jgi:hypothetical protein
MTTAATGEGVIAVAGRGMTGDIKLKEVQIRSVILDLHLEMSYRGPMTLDLWPG